MNGHRYFRHDPLAESYSQNDSHTESIPDETSDAARTLVDEARMLAAVAVGFAGATVVIAIALVFLVVLLDRVPGVRG